MRSPVRHGPTGQTVAVGQIVPDDFSLRTLVNDEERAVVEALRDHLSDDWLVLPDVALATDRRDHQIDVVLVHPREGLAVIEVKGHRVQLRHGQFVPDRGHLPVQPHVQARQQRLRSCGTGCGRRRRSWPT